MLFDYTQIWLILRIYLKLTSLTYCKETLTLFVAWIWNLSDHICHQFMQVFLRYCTVSAIDWNTIFFHSSMDSSCTNTQPFSYLWNCKVIVQKEIQLIFGDIHFRLTSGTCMTSCYNKTWANIVGFTLQELLCSWQDF